MSKDATTKEIKSAFKKKSLKLHPDKNLDNQEWAKTEFQKVANAYEVLSDEGTRDTYNQFGMEGVQQKAAGGHPGGGGGASADDFEKIFEAFFGGGKKGKGGGAGGGQQGF